MKERRTKVTSSPADRSEVDRWQSSVKIAETPVCKYAAVLRKARERPERDDEFLQRVPTLYCSSPRLYSFGLSVCISPNKLSNPRKIHTNNIWR